MHGLGLNELYLRTIGLIMEFILAYYIAWNKKKRMIYEMHPLLSMADI